VTKVVTILATEKTKKPVVTGFFEH
jgi:hypothetical protein